MNRCILSNAVASSNAQGTGLSTRVSMLRQATQNSAFLDEVLLAQPCPALDHHMRGNSATAFDVDIVFNDAERADLHVVAQARFVTDDCRWVDVGNDGAGSRGETSGKSRGRA